jgi:hypothetical protein
MLESHRRYSVPTATVSYHHQQQQQQRYVDACIGNRKFTYFVP